MRCAWLIGRHFFEWIITLQGRRTAGTLLYICQSLLYFSRATKSWDASCSKVKYRLCVCVCVCVCVLTRRQCSAMQYHHLHPWPRWSRWPAAGPSPPPCGLGEQRPAAQFCPGSWYPPARNTNAVADSLEAAMVQTQTELKTDWLGIIWAWTTDTFVTHSIHNPN